MIKKSILQYYTKHDLVIFLRNNAIDFPLTGKALENNLSTSFYKNNVLNYGKTKHTNMLI